ncbi:hypothetical protein DMENIID0001_028810 [Sergentomyia squamirostris]
MPYTESGDEAKTLWFLLSGVLSEHLVLITCQGTASNCSLSLERPVHVPENVPCCINEEPSKSQRIRLGHAD